MLIVMTLVALLCVAEPPEGVTPQDRLAFEDLTPSCQAYLKRHARTTFAMPDGSVWDGFYYFELRKILDTHLSLQPIKRSVPVGPIMRQDKTIGYRWKLSDADVVKAWRLGASTNGDVSRAPRRPAIGRGSTDGVAMPPLWNSADAGNAPIYFDDGTFLGTTGDERGESILVTHEYEDGTLDIQGWVPIYSGSIGGRALLDEGIRANDGRIRGRFFVHYPPKGKETTASVFITRVDPHRVTAEQLLDLVQDGRIELFECDYKRTSDGRYIWRRETFRLEARKQGPAATPPRQEDAPGTPKEEPPPAGLDRVLLKDGRLFVGKVLVQDDKTVTIRTLIGTLEAELSFAKSEVANVHIEAEDGPDPRPDK